MNQSVRRLINVGLRNPFFIEILSYTDEKLRQESEPFAIESRRAEYSIISEMKVSVELPEEVKLNELPTTLINYYL